MFVFCRAPKVWRLIGSKPNKPTIQVFFGKTELNIFHETFSHHIKLIFKENGKEEIEISIERLSDGWYEGVGYHMEKKNFISIELLFLQEDSTLLHLKFLVKAVYFAC